MRTKVRYVVASTGRRLGPEATGNPWAPAGEAHAVYLSSYGRLPSVSMCGRDIGSLHLFEDRGFLEYPTGSECRECRQWVRTASRDNDA